MRPFFLLIFGTFLIFALPSYSQDYRKIYKHGDSLYHAKDYSGAIRSYKQAEPMADFVMQRALCLFQMACSYSMLGNTDSAFILLREAIRAGYTDKTALLQEKDLDALHDKKEWDALSRSLKDKVVFQDPAQMTLFTDDIHRFWEAYDLAQQDTANRVAIYTKYYFDRGSKGLQDYMSAKVRSIRYFVKHYDDCPNFYRAIRPNTLKVDSLKPAMYVCFKKLKEIYPEALFPNIYFVMGAYTSAGTVSDAGLLIGINMISKTEGIPVGELNLWQKNVYQNLRDLPRIVSHELIHFEQDTLLNRDDTTALFNVEVEGMADFLGEMICGNNINQRLHTWAKGKEKKIWEAFTKDMYSSRSYNWLANAVQETPDNPADQGYWIGYQICKAYYMNAPDKRKAIYEMLHFSDSREFLRKSGWEKIVANLPE